MTGTKEEVEGMALRMLHCRVQLMNSQREEDDDINQKLSKSQQAACLTAAMNGKRSSSL